MYLNTERKGTPSSVLKKGSFSHRSGRQKTRLSNQMNVIINLHLKPSVSQDRPHCTCPALAQPGISVGQELLDGAVPQRIELQKHPLQGEISSG